MLTEKENKGEKLVRINKLDAFYDSKRVLHDVDLTIYKNDFLGIIGPNGGGKTTLIRCILGLHNQFTGTISYFKNNEPTKKLTLGYLPQYNSIDKNFPISVQEVIASGLSVTLSLTERISPSHWQKVMNVIEQMGLTEFQNRPIGKLSGGQLQRTLLGRAIVSNPDLLILDEPSTYIDREFESKLYELLQSINKRCAIILVSHDIGTVLQQVKSIACVNERLDYHPDTEISNQWLEEKFHCPIELLGHGNIPHRVLKNHT